MAGVLNRDANSAEEWMLGRLSSVEVIDGMGIRPRARLREDFLMRRLVLDCGRMKVNTDLFDVLRRLRAEATVVIATDNMGCFVSAYERAPAKPRPRRLRRRRSRPPAGGSARNVRAAAPCLRRGGRARGSAAPVRCAGAIRPTSSRTARLAELGTAARRPP